MKPHSSRWFSGVCAAAIDYRNHFFCLYEKNKPSESKTKLREAGNCYKRVLGAAKFEYSKKTKSPSLPRNSAVRTFGELPIVFSTKLNLLYLLYSTARGVVF